MIIKYECLFRACRALWSVIFVCMDWPTLSPVYRVPPLSRAETISGAESWLLLIYGIKPDGYFASVIECEGSVNRWRRQHTHT